MNEEVPRLRMFAEITEGHSLEMKTDQVPTWFKKSLGSKFNI
ncbi:MAG: hypothetical protein QM752_03950 [Gammaproteobacteria bacterium]